MRRIISQEKNEETFDLDVLFVKPSFSSRSEELHEYLLAATMDILLWWKNHDNIYTTLSRMSRDILCLQAPAVSSERLFWEASITLTNKKCSLSDECLKTLICGWKISTEKKSVRLTCNILCFDIIIKFFLSFVCFIVF